MSYVPYKIFDNIPHYYGDFVRILFVATAGISFFAIPLWGDVLPFGTMFEVVAGIILVVLAGLTSPHSQWVMSLNIVVAGIGVFLLELTAITYRLIDSPTLLLVREIEALALIAALYFSVKTVRAMSQKKIGALPRPWEFEEPKDTEETS